MDDSKEILFIALSNSLDYFLDLLESDEIDKDNRELITYLIKRHNELINKYSKEIIGDKPIQRPKWEELKLNL